MRKLKTGLAILAVAGMLAVLAVRSEAAAITKTNTIDGFADESSFTRSVSFSAGDFSGSSTITDLNVIINFAKSDDESFLPEGTSPTFGTPFFEEIQFTLTSPSGTSVTLISNGNSGPLSFGVGTSAGFSGTVVFDQQAALPVNTNTSVITAGTFQPATPPGESLNAFNGESAIGTFTLFIEDSVGGDGLSFYDFSVQVATVPEPSSLVLLGIGAICLVGYRRKRRRAHVAGRDSQEV